MRQQTPSLLKWLLVERATLEGAIERCCERDAALARALAEAEREHARLAIEIAQLLNRLAQSPEILAEKRTHQAALDTAIRIASEGRASPTAAGTVRAFAREYKERGAFKAFVVAALKGAAPNTVTTASLVQQAVDHFGFKFMSNTERRMFQKNTMNSQLLRLTKEGFVDALHTPRKGGVWRWKAALPSLADVAAEAAAYGR